MYTWYTERARRRQAPVQIGQKKYLRKCEVGLPAWRFIKAAFHYSSQLQTWSQTWSKACRQPAGNFLKRVFFSTFHLSSTRTNQWTCCGSRPGFQQKKSTAAVESVSQNRTNLSKTWLQTWSKTWLEIGIMKCGLQWWLANTVIRHQATSWSQDTLVLR